MMLKWKITWRSIQISKWIEPAKHYYCYFWSAMIRELTDLIGVWLPFHRNLTSSKLEELSPFQIQMLWYSNEPILPEIALAFMIFKSGTSSRHLHGPIWNGWIVPIVNFCIYQSDRLHINHSDGMQSIKIDSDRHQLVWLHVLDGWENMNQFTKCNIRVRMQRISPVTSVRCTHIATRDSWLPIKGGIWRENDALIDNFKTRLFWITSPFETTQQQASRELKPVPRFQAGPKSRKNYSDRATISRDQDSQETEQPTRFRDKEKQGKYTENWTEQQLTCDEQQLGLSRLNNNNSSSSSSGNNNNRGTRIVWNKSEMR